MTCRLSVAVSDRRNSVPSLPLLQRVTVPPSRLCVTGFDWADKVLWGNPELSDGIYVSRVHPRAEGERAAWAILSILCRNPLWLLVASCCSASVRNRLPTCGRPMQVLLAFLGGPCCSGNPSWVSLRAGCSSRPLALCRGVQVQCRRGTDVTWTGTPCGAEREGHRCPSG